jgi:hypothetical protein
MREIDAVLEQHCGDGRVRIVHQHYQAILNGFDESVGLINMLWEHVPDGVCDMLIATAQELAKNTDRAGAHVMRVVAGLPLRQ